MKRDPEISFSQKRLSSGKIFRHYEDSIINTDSRARVTLL